MATPKQINVVRGGKWTPIPWEEFALSGVDWDEWPGGAAEILSSQRHFKARVTALETDLNRAHEALNERDRLRDRVAEVEAHLLDCHNALHMTQRVMESIQEAVLKDDNLVNAADFNELEAVITAAIKN